MAKAYDVVCGMVVDSESASHADHDGTTYHFCCDGCKGAFEKSPDYHLESWAEVHPGATPTVVVVE